MRTAKTPRRRGGENKVRRGVRVPLGSQDTPVTYIDPRTQARRMGAPVNRGHPGEGGRERGHLSNFTRALFFLL